MYRSRTHQMYSSTDKKKTNMFTLVNGGDDGDNGGDRDNADDSGGGGDGDGDRDSDPNGEVDRYDDFL